MEGFAHEAGDAAVHEKMRMAAVAGAGEDFEVREVPPRHVHHAQRFLHVLERHDEDLGRLGPRGAQQVWPAGIAVVHLVAEAAHGLDLGGILLEGGEGDALQPQDAGDDLTDPAEAADDDGRRRAPVMVSYWGSLRDCSRGMMRRSEAANRTGVAAMDNATISVARSAKPGVRACAVTAAPNSTKLNSLPCGRARAKRTALRAFCRASRARPNATASLATSRTGHGRTE